MAEIEMDLETETVSEMDLETETVFETIIKVPGV